MNAIATAKRLPIQDITVAWNDGSAHYIETNTNAYGEGFIGQFPLELHTNHEPKVGSDNGGTGIRNGLVKVANQNNAVIDAAGGERDVTFNGTIDDPAAGQFEIGVYRGASVDDLESTQVFSGAIAAAPEGIRNVIAAAEAAAAAAKAID